MRRQVIKVCMKKLEAINIRRNTKWAIYGTGNGAKLIYVALKKLNLLTEIKYVLDRDDKVGEEDFFKGIPIKKLSDIVEDIDGILIAAMENQQIILDRVKNALTEGQLSRIELINIFAYNSIDEQKEYVEYLEKAVLRKSDEFVNYTEENHYFHDEDTKIITWYLPQFHQIDINDRFHGKGFTEWTNTTRAIPMYTGHYQPHIPYDVGYYDLMNLDTLKKQITLAKKYGIYGFCIHYYWFSGQRIMEKPLELLLEHKELDIPFCLDWATENWSALWDGGNKELIFEQKLQEDDDERFMLDILPYMKDSRYIKIDGKPILVIYRINMFEKERVKRLLLNFREIAKKEGFPDLYIMLTNAFEFDEDVKEWGADALVEFPPHGVLQYMDDTRPMGYLNPYFNGSIKDAKRFIRDRKYMTTHNSEKYFRSALLSWDNTARKATTNGMIIDGLTPKTFRKWFKDIVIESAKIHSKNEDIVFINSWNEWAEGSHLEPDMRYGYAYLQTVKDVLEEVKAENK